MSDTRQLETDGLKPKVGVFRKDDEVLIVMDMGGMYYVMNGDEASDLGASLLGAAGALTLAERMLPELDDGQIETVFGETL